MLRAVLSPCFAGSAQRACTGLMAPSTATHLEQRRGRRRSFRPPSWVPPQWEAPRWHLLDDQNKDLLRQTIEAEHAAAEARIREGTLEPQIQPTSELQTAEDWGEGSKRVGLVCRKLGMVPQWLNDGRRVLCTMLEVPSNNVIGAVDPETWYRTSIIGKRKAFNRFGPMWKVTVGASDAIDVTQYSRHYRSMFARVGVPVKELLGSFVVTADAVPSLGVRLDARHFDIGQYVTVSGRTIDWGFQGAMHRWGFKGQPKNRTTKSHRRVGSIGSVGDAKVWPGKRLPGHMGYEWRLTSGLQVLRINVEKQVIYVKGCTPGDAGETLLLKDCHTPQKITKTGPFPTWKPSEEEEVKAEEAAQKKKEDLAIPNLFRFSSPSILFKEDETKKKTARDKTKAKIAKVKK